MSFIPGVDEIERILELLNELAPWIFIGLWCIFIFIFLLLWWRY
jgi:hypothetical protein